MASAGESDDEDEDDEEGDAVSEDGSFASVDDLDGTFSATRGCTHTLT